MPNVEKPQVICRSLHPADYPAVKEIIASSFPQVIQQNPQGQSLRTSD